MAMACVSSPERRTRMRSRASAHSASMRVLSWVSARRVMPCTVAKACSGKSLEAKQRSAQARALGLSRAGGGTLSLLLDAFSEEGLSPRRRGNHVAIPPVCSRGGSIPALGGNRAPRRCRLRRLGSIPAQAGEPRPRSPPRHPPRVYPRAGGGTAAFNLVRSLLPGLSPRRRGNQDHRAGAVSGQGSIPAQAGEPRPLATARPSARVYPRAGGGTRFQINGASTDSGLSPRRRGNPRRAERAREGHGSIPAQAGEPASARTQPARTRSIPAQAGEPWAPRRRTR